MKLGSYLLLSCMIVVNVNTFLIASDLGEDYPPLPAEYEQEGSEYEFPEYYGEYEDYEEGMSEYGYPESPILSKTATSD